MGEVLHQRERLRAVSISRLAELLGMDRKTVSKRIADSNLKPAGMRDGYRLRWTAGLQMLPTDSDSWR